MEKLFDALLLDLMEIVMIGCFGSFVMDWLQDDMDEWTTMDGLRAEDMKIVLN